MVVFQTDLNDTHYQLLVHWAGDNSNGMVALARNASILRPTSTVYISTNYGASFNPLELNLDDGRPAMIDKFIVSPVSNTHVS